MKTHKFIKKIAEKSVEKNVNSACIMVFYQPKVPAACSKFKKSK